MADVDEDHFPTQPSVDVDVSEETQDFRLLNHVHILDTDQSGLPRRGEKDFEPNPTLSQQSSLAASRQAMHDALSYPRLHNPRNHPVAVFCPDSTTDACVRVDHATGKMFQTMGSADSRNATWLLPEEALYLIERGSLDIQWPAEADGAVPMSLQAAYARLIGNGGLTLERFTVYCALKRLGYVLIRAATWDDADSDPNGGELMRLPETESRESQAKTIPSNTGFLNGFVRRLFPFLFPASPPPGDRRYGPLIMPGLYRSYNDIFRALALIPSHDPSQRLRMNTNPKRPFRISYDVYKPSTPFKKTAPPEPDFRLAVVDARCSSMPRLDQIASLLDSMPHTPPGQNRPLEAKLKHGHRTVLLAVVDMGTVSYLRFSDAAFGNEKLYEQKFGRRLKGKRHGPASHGKKKFSGRG
ncbi:MAG: hypothetical protein Q9160_003049 [Pyrenula sp. 1 TL-2023]